MQKLEIQKMYINKKCSAKEAADLLPNGAKVAMAVGAGQPTSILNALAQRAKAGKVSDINFYYLLCTSIAGKSIFDIALADKLNPVSYFHSGVERELDKARFKKGLPAVDFVPCHFSQAPRSMVEHVGVDTLFATVSSMDAEGNFSLGTNTDYSLAVAQKPSSRVILEVNPNMPYVRGNCLIPLSKVTCLVEDNAPLPELPLTPSTEVDDTIGNIIAELVQDGDCLQMGIGALPDAVCDGLKNHRHLGIHTEMMTMGMAKLMQAGVVDNSLKKINKGKSVYTFSLGDRQLYQFLNHNSEVEAHPVDYTNNPFIISQNDNVVSVNATMQIDLSGACNSEFMNERQFSGSGGQLDFVRGAYASKGGRSIIACHSTAANGTILGLGVYQHFLSFIGLLAALVPPIIGPVIVDYYIVNKTRYNTKHLAHLPSWNPLAMVSYIIGASSAYAASEGINLPASQLIFPSLYGLSVSMLVYGLLSGIFKLFGFKIGVPSKA